MSLTVDAVVKGEEVLEVLAGERSATRTLFSPLLRREDGALKPGETNQAQVRRSDVTGTPLNSKHQSACDTSLEVEARELFHRVREESQTRSAERRRRRRRRRGGRKGGVGHPKPKSRIPGLCDLPLVDLLLDRASHQQP